MFIGCNKTDKKDTENFAEFDERFHSDSLFQISRIIFPLAGKSIDGFEKKNWSKSKWEMLKVRVAEKIEEKEYQNVTTLTDSLVEQKIWIVNSGFSFEQKFKKINGKWFLIYLNDINL